MTAGKRVVVVGAGVAGLTTAVVLAEAGASVHVIAEQVPGVTSLAAGAMWGPYLVEPKDKVDQWGQRSLEIFRELAQDPATGVRLTSGIEASRTAEAAPDWATLCLVSDRASGPNSRPGSRRATGSPCH